MNAVDAVLLFLMREKDSGETFSQKDELNESRARVQDLLEENAVLRRDSAFRGTIALNRTLTRVLWYDPDPSRRSVRIAIPRGEKVSEGDAVVVAGNILVGQISRVFSETAEVLLLEDPTFRMSVRIGDAVGVAAGNGGFGMDISHVRKDEQLPPEGSAVYSAGLDAVIPRGLLVGWLTYHDRDAQDPFAALALTPAEDTMKLGAVFVIISHVQ